MGKDFHTHIMLKSATEQLRTRFHLASTSEVNHGRDIKKVKFRTCNQSPLSLFSKSGQLPTEKCVFKYLEIFLIVGAVYLMLVSLATCGLNRLEDAIGVPGFQRPKF